MKKQMLMLTLFAGIGYLNAAAQTTESVKWYSIEEAEKLNKENPKKIMIDVYTDWCGWCKKMDKETFNHPVIAKYINENYYPVKLNAESKTEISFRGTPYKYVAEGNRGYNELAANLLNGQMSYPSIAYLNEKLELLGAVPGYMTAKDIEPLLSYIVENKFTDQSLADYQSTFKSSITE